MDASPNVLAESVRSKRVAIDNDLELLRVRLRKADPRRIDTAFWTRRVLPVAAGAMAMLVLAKRPRRVRSLEQLLVHGLRDLYSTERQLVPALDRLRAQASNPDLVAAIDQHRYETEGHVERLGRVFRSVNAEPKRGASAAVSAIVRDGERLLARKANPSVRDSWIIATVQRLEHLEIAGYGTARTYAEMLGFAFAAQLLQQTLDEERATDEKLTHLAERFVNPQSLRAPHS